MRNQMSIETNKAIVRRLIEQVWNNKQVELIDEFFTEEVVSHVTGYPPGSGLDSTEDHTALYLKAFPDLMMTIEDDIAEGDKVVLRWTMTATQKGELPGIPATGKQVVQSGMTVYRLDNAKIAESWFLADNMSLMQQLGVIPTRDAA